MSKITKYIFALVLFFVAFFIVGLFSDENLFSFQNKYAETSVYLQNGQSQNDLCNDIVKNAELYDVSVFSIESKVSELNNNQLTIYCTYGTQEFLSNHSGIHEGTYTSLFSESTRVKFDSIAYMPENENGITLYMIGDWEDICRFKSSLVDKYAGKFPSKGSNDMDIPMLYGIWIIVFFVLLIFTLFEIISFNKEKTILVVNGRSIVLLMIKKILTDSIALSIIYISAYMLSSQLCNSKYQIKGVSLCFLLFLIVNAMCYLLMLRFDVKKSFSNTATNKTILSFLGISKAFISVCIILIFSFLRLSLNESISFFKQNNFFQSNNDLNYVLFTGKMNQTSEEDLIDYSDKYYKLCSKFYQQYQNDAVILDWISDIDNHCVMNMNSAALKKFSNNIKLVDKNINISHLIEENEQVVFIPEDISEQSIGRIMRLKSDDSEIKLIKYKRFETVCIGADHDYISSYETDPVVFFNLAYSSPRTILYKVSENDVKNFLKTYYDSEGQWEYKINSATEMYNIYKNKIKNIVIVYLGLMILLIVIAIMTIVSITKFYFIFHKSEFALKYCLGYNFIQFLSFPIAFNVIILLVSLVCAGILSLILKLNLSMDLAYGAGLVLLMDCVTLLAFYFSFIQKNIVQILKGKAI